MRTPADVPTPAWSRNAPVVLLLLVLAYLLPGSLGHEPWKPDEPYTLGVVRSMLHSGDWVVPMVDETPFVEKPPLFYWAATIATRAFHGLPQHDAARLASAFFVLVSMLAIAAAARLCWGHGSTSVAALLFLGTLGLEGHAQRLQVDHALVAGFALAMLGFAAHVRERWWAGAAIGAGTAIGFLSKGLLAPAAMAVTALLLPLAFASWRTRRYGRRLVEAAAVSLPLMVGWPLALWHRDPALFDEWFWANNVGRFLGYSIDRLGATSEPGFWPQTLPWFLFPVWVYAAAPFFREGRRAWERPGVQIGAAMSAVLLAVLLVSASGRAIYAMPLLPPLALMSIGAAQLPDGALARVLARVSIAVAILAALVVWPIWASLLASGSVPAWTHLQRHFPVPFNMPFNAIAVACALALTLGYAALAAFRGRLAHPALTLWVGALALAWGLAMTLWLPWIDSAKGYRDVLLEAAAHVPGDCIVLRGLGESERAMVSYYTDLRVVRRRSDCDAILWLGKPNTEKHRPTGSEWVSVWAGSRPGEGTERFEIFVRRPPP
jgi:4-amino-4-deoxy-L-arabinose transferase-like glycosyltransferase